MSTGTSDAGNGDFFRNRLDQMIDLRHSLVVLGSRLPWQAIEARVAHRFARQVRSGKQLNDSDLFGPTTSVVGAGVAKAGRPRLPLRRMLALLYLKHAFNESDEGVVARWAETPTWQYFSGEAYFSHHPPCDPSLLVRFRQVLGEQGIEELLAHTINTAVNLKLIDQQALASVIVDSTVQPKAVAYPTDSGLLETAREKVVEAAKAAGIALKQTFVKEGQRLQRKAGRYAHARQFKRMRGMIKRQRTIVGKLCREVVRKLDTAAGASIDSIKAVLAKAQRIHAQTLTNAAKDGPKLYSWHAPEVECIGKGKARTPYEFGVKVSVATTHSGNLIVGARAFAGNPYDGHTLHEQLEQASILMQDTGVSPTVVTTDLGYRGVDQDNPGITLIHRGKLRSLTAQQAKLLPRRQSIEPVIGHLKHDHGMARCYLKGATGDRLHALLCAAGFNLRWLMRNITKKGIRLFLRALLASCQQRLQPLYTQQSHQLAII